MKEKKTFPVEINPESNRFQVKEEPHEHDLRLVGAIANTHLCFKCGKNLVANLVEILNQDYEIGGFCDDEKCERFLILVC